MLVDFKTRTVLQLHTIEPPTIVWNPNGNQIVDVNNSDNNGGGNITVTQTGTVTITNGDFNIKLRGQHQGSNTAAWSTTFNATIGTTNYNEEGLLNQTAPAVTESEEKHCLEVVFTTFQ